MNLRGKLLLAQLPLASALLLVGVVAVSSVSRLGGQTQVILKDNYRSVLAAERMKESIERLDSAATFLLAGRPDKALPQAAEHRRLFEEQLQLEEKNLTEPGEPVAARRLRDLFNAYLARFDRFVEMSDLPSQRTEYFDHLQPAFVHVKDAADEILGINQDAMVRKSDRASRFADTVNTLVLSATLAAFVLGLGLSSLFTTRLLRPLQVLRRAVQRIGHGDLDARAHIEGRDEVARLADDFNQMAQHLAQYRKSSLGELLQAQQSSQAAIDSLPDPVVIFGLEGNVLNVNRAGETLLGLDIDGGAKDALSAVEPDIRGTLQAVRDHVLSGKGPYAPKGFDEAVPLPSDDGARYLLPRATPVYSEMGGIVGVTVVLQDVSRLRRFDELKNDLFATVAHEFRTPLTSLRMAVHLCIEEAAGPLTDKQADLLHAAREDCERLQTIVDELLDLARIQGGRMELSLRPTQVARLLESAVSAQQKGAEDRKVRLRVAVLPGVPDVLADRERVLLVLSNLLTNALRHTPEGGAIEVRARLDDEAPPGVSPGLRPIYFEVADTGTGIPLEIQGMIFEKFFRAPGAPAGGAGLGLSIAREIVTAHGGQIGLSSVPGQGSTFWFTLPAAVRDEAEQE